LTNSSDDGPAGEGHAFCTTISTDAFPEGKEIEGWNEANRQLGYHVRLDVLEGHRLQGGAVIRALPGLGLFSGTTSVAVRLAWSEQQMSGDDVVILFHLGRGIVTRQRGREESADCTEAVVMSAVATGSIDMASGRTTSLQAPRAAFRGIADEDRLFNRKLRADNPALKLLQSYLSVLRDPEAVATPRQSEMVVAHVHDLLALAVGASGDARAEAIVRGGAAARLHALKADIDRHLFEHELGAKFLAKANGVTPRHVHRLFEAEGASLSQYVLERRLLEAYRLLAAPDGNGRTVADIAFSIGFNDLSYFNRVFVRRFSAQPREVRSLFGTSRAPRPGNFV
jgi:AraC-like DNA-binding protein